MVSLLLDKKANIEHRAKTGLTPLMEAASSGYELVGRMLLDRGADVNATPAPVTKETALTIAAERGHVKFVQLLTEYGAHLEAKNKKGCTALWLACHNGHYDVCQYLTMNHADCDAVDVKRVSCLMAAFRRGQVKICKFLVKHVRHYPSDQDCVRYINTLNMNLPAQQALQQQHQQQPPSSQHPASDKELVKKCQQCLEIIVQAKEKQAQEANRNANNLLKEIDAEKSREQSKKAAAQRKREKRKMKKMQAKIKNNNTTSGESTNSKQQQQQPASDDDDDDDDDPNDEENDEPEPNNLTIENDNSFMLINKVKETTPVAVASASATASTSSTGSKTSTQAKKTTEPTTLVTTKLK